MLGNVPSGCVYSFDMYVFRLGDEILVAGGEKIIEKLAAAYRPAMSIEQVSLFSPSSGGASFSRLPLITYGRRSSSNRWGPEGLSCSSGAFRLLAVLRCGTGRDEVKACV